MISLLAIEDDSNVVEMLKLAWPDTRDRLEFVSTAKQARRLIFSGELSQFDCILVDINLPDGSGLDLLREIREVSTVPIILISGAGNSDTRADAITSGADDYVMKPFNVREVSARVHRLGAGREKPETRKPKFRLGAIEFDLGTRSISTASRSVNLTDLEMRILSLLFEYASENCTKSMISRKALFREYNPQDKTIDVYINRLRNHLDGLVDGAAAHIQTVRGVGYRLEGAT